MSIAIHTTGSITLGKIQFADYNPRDMSTKEMEKLKRSLHEFGFVEPVVARKSDGLLIGGHQRVTALGEALAEEGHDENEIAAVEIPAMLVELSDDKCKLLNLALNKIAGEWNYSKLEAVIASIDQEREDIELSGFVQSEIDDIRAVYALPEVDEVADKAVEEELAAQSRRFSFEVPTAEEAQLCEETLVAYGKTGPKSVSAAFVAALTAALEMKHTKPKKGRA